MTGGVPHPITLILADDHPLFLAAVRDFLAQEPGIRVLGIAVDGPEALRSIRHHQPDVAVLDLAMPGLTGLAVAHAVQENGLNTTIVLLTMHQEEHVVRSALAHGIRHYVLKEDLDSHLIPAIQAALAKRAYFSPKLLTAALRATIAKLP